MMDTRKLLETLHLAERLKDATRHSWTSQGRRESVAEHSWRLALMAIMIGEWFPGADVGKMVQMAVLHDLGEAFTGDIPAFVKTDADRQRERQCLEEWFSSLPEPYCGNLRALFDEMEALRTIESRIVKALDKLETLVQHNEAEISTWLPLEYEKNLTYGREYTAFSEKLEALRREICADTLEKIRRSEKDQNTAE